MKKKWILITDKRNRFEFKAEGERFMLACCDCGLTHDIGIALENSGKIGLAFKRNQKQTMKNRNSWK